MGVEDVLGFFFRLGVHCWCLGEKWKRKGFLHKNATPNSSYN